MKRSLYARAFIELSLLNIDKLAMYDMHKQSTQPYIPTNFMIVWCFP